MLNQLNIPEVAVGVVVEKEGKILLVRRKKPPNQRRWAIPGGKVNLGETLQQAAEREILEETGLRIKAGEPVYVFDFIERSGDKIVFHYVIIDLLARYISGTVRAQDDAAAAAWWGPECLATANVDLDSNTRKFLSSWWDEKRSNIGCNIKL